MNKFSDYSDTKIMIGQEEYYLIKNYKEIDKYRNSLNALAKSTFVSDFAGFK